ncbi:sensor histidine kinase, partial [Rhizobium phaseoli]
MNWLRRWNARSLASQFFIAGGLVSIAAMFLIGILVTHLIEDAVIHNSGAATALYVDSVVAPLLPDMQTESLLDEASAQALDETL